MAEGNPTSPFGRGVILKLRNWKDLNYRPEGQLIAELKIWTQVIWLWFLFPESQSSSVKIVSIHFNVGKEKEKKNFNLFSLNETKIIFPQNETKIAFPQEKGGDTGGSWWK